MFESHLGDTRLHIVAAPGAGKTTLGLEAFRRLKMKALVLSPTRTIRDQWIKRLSDFINGDDPRLLSWVSNDINDVRFLTSVTYQALHSKMTDGDIDEPETDEEEKNQSGDPASKPEIELFIDKLKRHQVELIILDEAHHLRHEWWQALDDVMASIPGLTLISLTATPPYDSNHDEWRRYQQLCGPIDEEISIPELVKARTLCPHQDYVWASDVSANESQQLADYDARTKALCDSLKVNDAFIALIEKHPWCSLLLDINEVTKNPRLAVALISFLKALGKPLPQRLMDELDLTQSDIPELSRKWWQALLEGILFGSHYKDDDEELATIEQIKKALRAAGLLSKRDITIQRSRKLRRTLSLSASKVESCVHIHLLESRTRGAELRQVILTDYIRDEHKESNLETGEPTLGAVPIFDRLIRASQSPQTIGLITGRLAVIHRQLKPRLANLAGEKIQFTAYADSSEYLQVIGPLNQLTSVFTELLSTGELSTLIGTRALLGEGWDAPSVNSLILASVVGSFMLTNQMRGRAIRINKHAPNKVSSIWHLVALDTQSESGSADIEDLWRRFGTFVGLSHADASIRSGFSRMDARFIDIEAKRISAKDNNQQMSERYLAINEVAANWQKALILDENASIKPSVKAPSMPSIRAFHFKHTLKTTLLYLLFLAPVLYLLLGQPIESAELRMLLNVVSAVGVLAFVWNSAKLIKALRVMFRHLAVDGAVRSIAESLLHTLADLELIKTPKRVMSINSIREEDGSFQLSLSGATFQESSIFADNLAELLLPIDNPRYLITRQGSVYGLQRDDFHAVPIVIGTRKERAEIFLAHWQKLVGPGSLIYTRSNTGRSQLLNAKMRAYSSMFKNEVSREDRWQ